MFIFGWTILMWLDNKTFLHGPNRPSMILLKPVQQTSGLHWLRPGCCLGRKSPGYCKLHLSHPSMRIYQGLYSHYCSPSKPPRLCSDSTCLRYDKHKAHMIIAGLNAETQQCKYSKCVKYVSTVSLTLSLPPRVSPKQSFGTLYAHRLWQLNLQSTKNNIGKSVIYY